MPDQNRRAQDNEAAQRILDPHRVEDQRKAREETEFRLGSRGIAVGLGDADGDVADVLDTVERFEAEVERSGGDLMINQIGTSEPQDTAFVPPVREAGEPISQYLRRLEDAIAILQERRRRSE